jgi:hypothetical protein
VPASEYHHLIAIPPQVRPRSAAAADDAPQPPPTQRQQQQHTGEVHVFGEIVGASGFGARTLFCTWRLAYDTRHWRLLRGEEAVSCCIPPCGSNLSIGIVGRFWCVSFCSSVCSSPWAHARPRQSAVALHCYLNAALHRTLQPWLMTTHPTHAPRGLAPQGRTHVSGPASPDDADTIWEHPLAFVLGARSYQKWPCLVLKVRQIVIANCNCR